MNRAQMIEKAARASHQEGLDSGSEHAEWDALREVTRREYRQNAAAVVDALLPEIATVDRFQAQVSAVEALTGGPFSDGYRPYAVEVQGEVIFAVGLDDLRAALAVEPEVSS